MPKKRSLDEENAPLGKPTGKGFAETVLGLFSTHAGVFLGENHNDPAMIQCVTALMPRLK